MVATREDGTSGGPLEGMDPVASRESSGRPGSGWRATLRALGPGLVTGASDDDPSGIATYSQAGAKFGMATLWTAPITFVLMTVVQEICDRTALATGSSLGELARRRFTHRGRVVVGGLLVALLIANALNIGADLAAIGAGMNLLHLGPAPLWALLAGMVISVMVASGSFARIANVFKILSLALLAYFVVLFFANVRWADVLHATVVPHIRWDAGYVAILVAVLGTTISPYLFFWQTAHRVEELQAEDLGGDDAVPLPERPAEDAKVKQRRSRLDVITGMALSNGVMFAIIVASAATLGAHGVGSIDSAAQAADALRPFAGDVAVVLFAFGFIATGALAVPVLAGSASSGLAGLLGRDWGYSRSVREAPLFYVLVAVGTIGGSLATLIGANPITMLVVVAIINGIAAAPFLIVLMLVAADRRIMGDQRNGRVATTIGWGTTAVMLVAGIAALATASGLVK